MWELNLLFDLIVGIIYPSNVLSLILRKTKPVTCKFMQRAWLVFLKGSRLTVKKFFEDRKIISEVVVAVIVWHYKWTQTDITSFLKPYFFQQIETCVTVKCGHLIKFFFRHTFCAVLGIKHTTLIKDIKQFHFSLYSHLFKTENADRNI